MQQTNEKNEKSLEKAFGFTLLQVVVDNLQPVNVVPESVGILAGLSRVKEIETLLDTCSNEKKWDIVTTLYTQISENKPLHQRWEQLLKTLWLESDSICFSGKLKILFGKLQEPTLQKIQKVITMFGKIAKKDILEAVFQCFEDKPVFLAELILDLGTKYDDMEVYGDNLLRLANMLMHCNHEEQAWQIFSLLDLAHLKVSFPYLNTFLKRDISRVLEVFRVDLKIQRWNELEKVFMFIKAMSKDRFFSSWISQQREDIKVLGYSYQAACSGTEESIVQAENCFSEYNEHISLICNLSALSMLTIAYKRSKSLKKNCWEEILLQAVNSIEEYGNSSRIMDNCEEKFERELEMLIPQATQYFPEVAHMFSDPASAFCFTVAAATPALECMISPEIRAWMRSKLLEQESTLLQTQNPVFQALKQKLYQHLKEHFRYNIHELLFPILFSLLDNNAICEKIKLIMPLNFSFKEEYFSLLNPDFSVSQFEKLYPWLINKWGSIVDVNKTLQGFIEFTAMDNSVRAYEIWQKLYEVDRKAIEINKEILNSSSENLDLECIQDSWEIGEAFDEPL